MSNNKEKEKQMTWSPLSGLQVIKRTQFRFTDALNNQGFFLYYTDNGINLWKLIEHAYYFPQAMATTTLNDVQKAWQCAVTLVPPANLIHGQVLMEQQARSQQFGRHP